jgi:hypothetical protein
MAVKKNKDKKKPAAPARAIVSDKVGNYETHTFFVNKAAKAKAFLKKVGLPKQLAAKD